MDDRIVPLEEKRKRLLAEVAEVTVEMNRLRGSRDSVPHYSVIEMQAHKLGQELSRTMQQRQMGEITANTARKARCPSCRTICDVTAQRREITALDGPLELIEPKAHCRRCRRDFFPAEGSDGL